jgi:DNA-binding NarL/FixJ family response regulator
MSPLQIAVVDDHPLFRNALATALEDVARESRIFEAGSLEEILARLDRGLELDLMLLDLTLPGMQGALGVLQARAAYPELPLIVVSANEEAGLIEHCMLLGAAGYVPKSEPVQRIRHAVRLVLAGGAWLPEGFRQPGAPDPARRRLLAQMTTLTRRETEVLIRMSRGLHNREIALDLEISEATVKAHASRLLSKLGVESRTQAVIALQPLARPGLASLPA